jgi:sugar phosphate permease
LEKENSKYRWIVLCTVLLCYIFVVTQRTAPGLITNTLMNEFTISASMIGLMSSIQFFAYSGLQIPIGIMADRYGPNYFLIVGTLLNGAGTLIYSFAPNEFFLLFARMLVGVGDSTIWVNLILILSQWFKAKEFVGLVSVAALSGSIGSLLSTVPFSTMISYIGWRSSFLTVGIILCLIAILLYFVLIHIPSKKIGNQPTKQDAPIKEENRENTIVMLKRIFSNSQSWATFLCHFGLVGTYIGFIGSWAVPYGMDIYGLTRSEASQLIMIGLIGAFIGSPVMGTIASRFDSVKRPYVVAHLVVVCSWFIFFLLDGVLPLNMMFLLFFLIGFGNGASALTFAVVRQSFESKVVGVATGFANTGGFLSAVLLPGIFGKVLDFYPAAERSTGYHYGLIIPILFSLLGLFGGFLIREKQTVAGDLKSSIG